MSSGSLIGPFPAGIVGKLPAHGDFVRHGADVALLSRLDRWLAEELGRVDPDVLGERLAALPAWCFLLTNEGGSTLGVMITSNDKVGRLFPVIGFAETEGRLTLADARRWCGAAVERLTSGCDAGDPVSTIGSALAVLAVEPVGEAETMAPGMLWWTGEEEPLCFGGLPVGADFLRLLLPGEVTA